MVKNNFVFSFFAKIGRFFQRYIKLFAKIILHLILILSLIIIFLTNYINESFTNVTFDQLYYSLITSEGTSSSVFKNGLTYIVPKILLVYLIIIILFIIKKLFIKRQNYLKIHIRSKTINISLFPFSVWQKLLASIILLIFSLHYIMTNLEIYSYIVSDDKSNLFETYYTNPENVEITAPSQKQNLIYIYVESMESSVMSTKNGGAFTSKITPNLESIALNNINFSNTSKIGGAQMPAAGSSWTVAGMVSATAGIPLKLPADMDNNAYHDYGTFLPGAYSLGEILQNNGYQNYLFIGSNASFGGRSDYFTYHGEYKIMDLNYAREEGWVDEDYYVWWGYEDSKLFEFAKEQLTEIANNDEPFNFTMLTTGTHFWDGYIDDECETPFDIQYLNAYYCSDYQIGQFIKWLEEQDFYDDTTIIITGDHLTMQENLTDMFDIKNANNYERTIYNAIINSKTKASNTTNRIFTTYDFYPTTLAALGFKINGNRLGLGTNLFSDRQTLAEEIGLDEFNEQIKLSSQYYDEILLENLEGTLSDSTASSSASSSK